MDKQAKLKALSVELQQIELEKANGNNGLTVKELDVELDKTIAKFALHNN